jgi:hypothetical protein
MWVPYDLDFGHDWETSLQAIDPQPERFDHHIRAMRFALKRDPVGWTEGFLAGRDALRVFRTQDIANAYELVVFLRVDERERRCELKWIDVRNLDELEEPNPGPKGLL